MRFVSTLLILGLWLCASTAHSNATKEHILEFVPEKYRELYSRVLADPQNPQVLFDTARELDTSGAPVLALRLYHRLLLQRRLAGQLQALRIRVAEIEYEEGNAAGALAQLELLETETTDPKLLGAAKALRERFGVIGSQHDITGRVAIGVQTHSNANRAPDGALDFVVPSEFGTAVPTQVDTPNADTSTYLDLLVKHRFRSSELGPMALESDLRIFGENYTEEDDFDRFYGEARLGLRRNIALDAPAQSSAKAYLWGRLNAFDGEIYSVTPGLGLELRYWLRSDFVLTMNQKAGWRFHGPAADVDQPISPISPSSTLEFSEVPSIDGRDRNGVLTESSLGLLWLPEEDVRVFVKPSFTFVDAKDEATSRFEFEISGGVGLRIADLSLVEEQPGRLIFSGSYGHHRYRDIDPAINPVVKRHDNHFALNAELQLPLFGDIYGSGGVRWSKSTSVLSGFDSNNTSGFLEIGWNF